MDPYRPYAKACGWRLALYVAAVEIVVIAGIWRARVVEEPPRLRARNRDSHDHPGPRPHGAGGPAEDRLVEDARHVDGRVDAGIPHSGRTGFALY